MMGDDQPPVDTTPPTLMTSTPGDAATKVSLVAPLTFVFDEALAASTVTEQSVKVQVLLYNYISDVKGTVTYDAATKTVTFTPALPLTNNVKYTVHLANTITDEAGNAYAGKDLQFLTVTNQSVKSTGYNSTTAAVTYWQSYSIDANGHQNRAVYFPNPGPDNIWFNGDDQAQGHQEYVFSPAGLMQEYRNYGPGPDALYNTGDDVITYLDKYKFDAQGRQIEYSSTSAPGPDAMWGTADDPISGYQAFVYMPTKVRYMYYSAVGNDGMWHTPDDRVTSYQEYTLDEHGYRTRYTNFNAGPDQLVDTSDDTVTSYYDTMNDANGTQTFMRRYTNAGPDGMWFTADDVTSYIQKWATDSKGYITSNSYINNPGPDTMWNTADDVTASYTAYTNNAQGLRTSQTGMSNPGPDGTYGTTDDVVSYYYTYTYDSNGQKTDSKYYGAPGADNVWKTGDDRVSQDEDFDIAH